MSNFSSPARQSFMVRNVQINSSLVQPVRFVRKELPSGDTVTWVKTRSMPKLIIRSEGNSFVGHLPQQRDNIQAKSSSERQVFLKMVESVWASSGKAVKQSWHPTPSKKTIEEIDDIDASPASKKAAKKAVAAKPTVKTEKSGKKPSFTMPKTTVKIAKAKKSVASIVDDIDDSDI